MVITASSIFVPLAMRTPCPRTDRVTVPPSIRHPLTDETVSNFAIKHSSRRSVVHRTQDWPVPVVQVESRACSQQIHMRLPVCGKRSHITPVTLFFIGLHTRDIIAQKIIRIDFSFRKEFGNDRPAKVVLGCPSCILLEGRSISNCVSNR